MKILITAAEDLIIRNVLDTASWGTLQPLFMGHEVTLIVPQERIDDLQIRFKNTNFQVINFKRTPPGMLHSFVATLLYAGVPTGTNHWSKMRAYLRGHARLVPTYLKRLHSETLARIQLYQALLRALYIHFGRDASAQALFDDVQPDLVISLSVTNFDTDVIVMAEAARRSIRTIGVTRSWDNLTSHGALRVVPDRLMVQNKFLEHAARTVQGISRTTPIDIIGVPHYESAMRTTAYAGSREEFCNEYGLDPSKKIILYGATGSFLFIREGDMLAILSRLVTSGAFGESAQILYREHPKFKISDKASAPAGLVFDQTSTYRTPAGHELSATDRLFRVIHHADVIVTGASTMAIDAAILNKPVVCIAFDGSARSGEVRYWESAQRFFDSYTHFEALVATGGVRVAHSPEALGQNVVAYLADPTRDREGRQRIVDLFVGDLAGSDQKLARIFKEELERVVTVRS